MAESGSGPAVAENAAFKRLVPVEHLPDTLWQRDDGCLLVPPDLARAYLARLAAEELTHLISARSFDDPPIGGIGKAETDAHFAQQFCGSVARAQLALLDPHEHIPHVADAFVQMFAGGTVAVLDVPSGAGALSLSLLCTVAELRARGVLPRLPLDVVVVGGEISEHARRHGVALFDDIEANLQDQAIFVRRVHLRWDACDENSNVDLITRFVAETTKCSRKLVAVSNFSGFLSLPGKQKQARPQLEQLFKFCAADGLASAVWIEPQTNAAAQGSGGLLSWLAGVVSERWARFARLVKLAPQHDADYRTEALLRPPTDPKQRYRVRLAVLRFELQRRP
jgi:hypothetical protein